jgi:hypothetical protein
MLDHRSVQRSPRHGSELSANALCAVWQLRGLNEVVLSNFKKGEDGLTGTPKNLKERAEKEVRPHCPARHGASWVGRFVGFSVTCVCVFYCCFMGYRRVSAHL